MRFLAKHIAKTLKAIEKNCAFSVPIQWSSPNSAFVIPTTVSQVTGYDHDSGVLSKSTKIEVTPDPLLIRNVSIYNPNRARRLIDPPPIENYLRIYSVEELVFRLPSFVKTIAEISEHPETLLGILNLKKIEQNPNWEELPEFSFLKMSSQKNTELLKEIRKDKKKFIGRYAPAIKAATFNVHLPKTEQKKHCPFCDPIVLKRDAVQEFRAIQNPAVNILHNVYPFGKNHILLISDHMKGPEDYTTIFNFYKSIWYMARSHQKSDPDFNGVTVGMNYGVGQIINGKVTIASGASQGHMHAQYTTPDKNSSSSVDKLSYICTLFHKKGLDYLGIYFEILRKNKLILWEDTNILVAVPVAPSEDFAVQIFFKNQNEGRFTDIADGKRMDTLARSLATAENLVFDLYEQMGIHSFIKNVYEKPYKDKATNGQRLFIQITPRTKTYSFYENTGNDVVLLKPQEMADKFWLAFSESMLNFVNFSDFALASHKEGVLLARHLSFQNYRPVKELIRKVSLAKITPSVVLKILLLTEFHFREIERQDRFKVLNGSLALFVELIDRMEIYFNYSIPAGSLKSVRLEEARKRIAHLKKIVAKIEHD